MDNFYTMKIESGTFEELRTDFNNLVEKMLTEMESAQAVKSAVNIKIKIELSQKFVPNTETKDQHDIRPALIPTITYEVGGKFKEETEDDIEVGTALVHEFARGGSFNHGDLELYWAGEKQGFILRDVAEPSLFEQEAKNE